jgi:CBS domain-containing protein
MRVRDFMSLPVESIDVTASPRAAREQMFRRKIRHLLVKRGGSPCGTVSDRDVARTADEAPSSGGTLERLVTPLAATVSPDATMRDVANLMRARNVESLPVVERSVVIGIVTIHDVLDFVGHGQMTSAGRSHRAILPRRGPRGAPRSVR